MHNAENLAGCELPLESLSLPAWSENLVNKWVLGTQHLISTTLSPAKLERMAWNFYHANKNKQFIGIRHFLEKVSRAIQEQKQVEVVVREDLVALLVSCFNLGVEGNSTALQRCDAFPEWCSESTNDLWFGVKSAPLQLPLGGFNSYFNLLGASEDVKAKILARTIQYLDSKEPTRVLFIGPCEFIKQVGQDKRFIEIAYLKTGARSAFSIILALNKISMWMDPISWSGLCIKFRDWADKKLREVGIS